jgi:sortase A
MRKWMGVICVFIGFLCIISSVSFVVYNRWQDKNSEKITQSLLEDVQKIITDKTLEHDDTEMATVKVDDYDCIGVLSIPVLDLELPVLTDWSYAKLKKAPCHYYGSYNKKDFVIAAHNYKSHFGRLSELQAGDIIVFTDVSGVAHYYEVAVLETLPKNATKEMITSGFDLSLYTCTLGGGSRITVRCKITENIN